ncbi:MAG: DeoR/GlpR family DNA-binding transcription regulator [Streptococcaceae bacterium]|jgi:DeoR/GlpR family transcriptional regulator of sugar metabolism|nr:DeoR/GlpR family DNA-binding transcription regulator [Streptococcaceae bacterium]
MKRSKKEVNERRSQILNLLEENKDIRYENLAKTLNISSVTLRRDLAALEKMGKIVRKHGKSYIKDFLAIDEQTIDEIELIKNEIGKVAANLIQDNSAIFINSGTTPLYALKHLNKKNVTVLTNNAKVTNLPINEGITTILSGGEINYPKETLLGPVADNFFESANADAAILGVYGFSLSTGITSKDLREAMINNTIMRNTNGPIIVVADYRKIGLVSNFKSGELARVNYLITDQYTDSYVIQEFEKLGITVIQVFV